MISWIQRYFQHHFKTIFAVLLAVTIISFIFTIGASPGIGRADRQVVDRYFFGYNLSLQSDQQRLMGDASLSAMLRVGYGLDSEQIQNYAFQRAASLHLADEWHIPPATTDEITKQIKTLRIFAGQDGQFDPKAYQKFQDNLKTSPRNNATTAADVARVISDDVRAEKVQNLLAGPGYVLPGDVKTQLARMDTTWTLATATIDYNAYKPEIKPTDADLQKAFEQSGGRYDIQPRVVVSVLEFPALNYMSKVSVTDDEVRKFYDANPSRFPKPPEANKPPAALAPNVTPPADPAADFAAVRPQVESTLKLERAQKLAAKEASDVSVALYDAKVNSPESFEQFVAARKLTAKTLPPFSRDAAPAELGGSPDAAAQAFRLSKDHAVSDPISTPTGSVILFWRETQPARTPAFAEVKAKVATDYVENERRKRFVELGRTLKSDIETRVKSGETFEKAATAAAEKAGVKAETKTLPAFTLRTRPQDIDYSVLGTLERLEKGAVSDMVINADKGILVYAIDKKAPDTSETNPQFVETRNQIASYSARIGSSAYLQELVEKELEKSKPKAE
jgi:peptidyl-prolyl cis-trans isomerase D